MESAAGTPGEPARDYAHRAIDAGVRTEFDQRLAGETRRSFEAGREQGRMEGGQTEREAQAAAHATAEQRRAHQAAELIDSFALERDRYLLAVEHEVVELALAVTARILRREAQMDPLLLTGAVRVALGQLSASTQVRLLVPPAELDLWTETFALLPKLREADGGPRRGDAPRRMRDRDGAGHGGYGDSRPVGGDRTRLLRPRRRARGRHCGA